MGIIHFCLYRLKEVCEFLLKLGDVYKRHMSPRLALCCDIPLEIIPPTTHFPHPFGIAIREKTILGNNCIIKQNVTIGMRRNHAEDGAVIGNNVEICANALILGPVNIADNVKIGAGAIVLKDVGEGQTIVGVWK